MPLIEPKGTILRSPLSRLRYALEARAQHVQQKHSIATAVFCDEYDLELRFINRRDGVAVASYDSEEHRNPNASVSRQLVAILSSLNRVSQ